jgi:hypothetical protein
MKLYSYTRKKITHLTAAQPMTVTSQQATMLCSICCGSVLGTLQDQDNSKSRPGCNHRVLAPCTSQQARSLMVPLMSGGGRVSTSRLASTAENVLQGQQQQHVYKLSCEAYRENDSL